MQILHSAPGGRAAPALQARVVWVVFGVASCIFMAISLAFALNGKASAIDAGLETWMHLRATPPLTDIMAAISFLGAPTSLTIVALVGGAVLLWLRRSGEAAVLAAVVIGGNLLNVALKHLIQRGRPVFDDPIFSLPTYSFPSGHAMATTVFYGLLAIHASRIARHRHSVYLAVGTAMAMIVLVCASRIYLGLHYLSDVMAGVSEGVAWLALSLGALQYVRRGSAGAGVDADG
jgi:membrane-associated phospholipid phosphatase